jgi:hypothetical protein
LNNVEVFASGAGDAGIQIHDCPGVNRAGLTIRPGGTFSVLAGLLWGNGNEGHGVIIAPGTHVWLSQTQTPPTITGQTGTRDFAFIGSTGPDVPILQVFEVARAFSDATGAYTESGGPATRATTWANLLATIAGGGFFGHATCLEIDASLVITGRGT